MAAGVQGVPGRSRIHDFVNKRPFTRIIYLPRKVASIVFIISL